MTQNYKLNGEDYIKYESTDLDFINEMRDDWEVMKFLNPTCLTPLMITVIIIG